MSISISKPPIFFEYLYFRSYVLIDGAGVGSEAVSAIAAIGIAAGGEGEPGDSRERRVTRFTRSAGLSAAAGGGVPLCRLFLGNRSLSAGWCVGRSVVQQPTCRSLSSSAGGRTVGRGIQLRGRALSLSLSLLLSGAEEPAKCDRKPSPDGAAPTQFRKNWTIGIKSSWC